ncbi:biotin--[acetyl-CoA-carboxylase] ligase [Arcobacter sp. CECT 8989]|uniref:biotin--[acetyl-CoA-carboxylase] ligase n=1 Tax=Arcobacter sp. CECT 8989 TaxID=2044509 RepID=UPI00100BA678|nr:biotin--[acetyl-CoA-carboxylase] ligase [Arcobacter sp. CECT 8989]RXJ99378.1 biotin--[acetyl-CoA-carboxylase] ligase [Arcobacter sp. CECT 8989]
MEIINLKEVDSTHTYLKELIKKDGFTNAICVSADYQSNGIGSRGNSWEGKEGNLFFSFVISKNDLPDDLQLQSASIYFSYILKEVLQSQGSKLWLKWPNDFYIDNKKIGGTITTATKDLLYCGIGLNLEHINSDFGVLDIKIDKMYILKLYFKSLEKKSSWKEIFNYFQIEFQKSRKYKATIENKKISLENAILNSDGSIQIDDKKVFSLR